MAFGRPTVRRTPYNKSLNQMDSLTSCERPPGPVADEPRGSLVQPGAKRYVLGEPSIGEVHRLWTDPLYGGIWRFEIPTYLPSQMLVDLAVTRHGRNLASLSVDIDQVPAALSQKFAAVRFRVSNEIRFNRRSSSGKPNVTSPVSRLGSWHEPHAASLCSCPTPAAYAAGVI